ncbi:DUF3617 domain-containing protein [Herminiimonas aquatilis]
MQPGLWEMTLQSSSMKNVPKISPEQIEKMRKMGVDMSQLQGGAIVNRICITKEMAARESLPQMNHKESGCEMKNQQRTSDGYTMGMVCDGAQMKGKGTVRTVLASDRSFSTTSEFKGTMQGVQVNDRTDTSGKWLSADCGSVRPITEALPGK